MSAEVVISAALAASKPDPSSSVRWMGRALKVSTAIAAGGCLASGFEGNRGHLAAHACLGALSLTNLALLGRMAQLREVGEYSQELSQMSGRLEGKTQEVDDLTDRLSQMMGRLNELQVVYDASLQREGIAQERLERQLQEAGEVEARRLKDLQDAMKMMETELQEQKQLVGLAWGEQNQLQKFISEQAEQVSLLQSAESELRQELEESRKLNASLSQEIAGWEQQFQSLHASHARPIPDRSGLAKELQDQRKAADHLSDVIQSLTHVLEDR